MTLNSIKCFRTAVLALVQGKLLTGTREPSAQQLHHINNLQIKLLGHPQVNLEIVGHYAGIYSHVRRIVSNFIEANADRIVLHILIGFEQYTQTRQQLT